MSDKARELLAAEYGSSLASGTSASIRKGGAAIDTLYGPALRAINAALRTAPDGWVMVSVEVIDAIRSDASKEIETTNNRKLRERVRDQAKGRAQGLRRGVAMIAAAQEAE